MKTLAIALWITVLALLIAWVWTSEHRLALTALLLACGALPPSMKTWPTKEGPTQ